MIAGVLAWLAVSAAAGPIELNGRCEYPDAVARYSQEASLVMCNRLVIDRAESTFDFGQRSWGSMLRFEGEISGDRMDVTRVYPRHRDSVEATGSCEILYRDGAISGVTCLARSGSKTFVANFVRSRL
jgi:hypothetical protein